MQRADPGAASAAAACRLRHSERSRCSAHRIQLPRNRVIRLPYVLVVGWCVFRPSDELRRDCPTFSLIDLSFVDDDRSRRHVESASK